MNKKGGFGTDNLGKIIWILVISFLAVVVLYSLFFTNIGEAIRRFDFW